MTVLSFICCVSGIFSRDSHMTTCLGKLFIRLTVHAFLGMLSVTWPSGVQLVVFFCSVENSAVLFDSPGISRFCNTLYLSIPSLSCIIGLISDVCVSYDS